MLAAMALALLVLAQVCCADATAQHKVKSLKEAVESIQPVSLFERRGRRIEVEADYDGDADADADADGEEYSETESDFEDFNEVDADLTTFTEQELQDVLVQAHGKQNTNAFNYMLQDYNSMLDQLDSTDQGRERVAQHHRSGEKKLQQAANLFVIQSIEEEEKMALSNFNFLEKTTIKPMSLLEKQARAEHHAKYKANHTEEADE